MEQIQQSFARLTLSEESECRSKLVSQRSETHRLRFRFLTLGEVGDPFSFVQQLQKECQGCGDGGNGAVSETVLWLESRALTMRSEFEGKKKNKTDLHRIV
ncbi:uncharacterized protein LOC113641783 [Tachysurus ichikawai]